MEEIKVSVVIPVYNSEDRLEQLLECVVNQTFTDFEVILVNDGSTDGSQEIIDRFCDADARFHGYRQENQGPAGARNLGLDHCSGEYVTFYDSDDLVPEDSMELMYRRAKETGADMVVGGRTNSYLTKDVKNKQAMRFAAKEKIDKYDEDFAYSFGLWNKFFRREIIEREKIRFEPYRNGQDGIFVFTFLKYCSTISGCNEIVYSYRKRPFFEEASVSQIKSYEGLAGICDALDRVKELHDEMLDEDGIAANDIRRSRFDDVYHFRIANVTFLDQYYRRIWLLDERALSLAKQKYEQSRGHLTEETLEKLMNRHMDLDLARPLMNKKELSRNPTVAIVVSGSMPERHVLLMLNSLYRQLLPGFVVIIDPAVHKNVIRKYKQMPNIIPKRGPDQRRIDYVLKKTTAEYLMFIDEAVCFEETTLRRMVTALIKNPEAEISMVQPYRLNRSKTVCKPIKSMEKLFRKKTDDEKFNEMDLRWRDNFRVNKLIRTASLRDPGKREAFLATDWNVLGTAVPVVRERNSWIYVFRNPDKEAKERAAMQMQEQEQNQTP